MKNACHIAMIERGERRDIAASTALAIARVFGVDVVWLITGEGSPPRKRDVRAAYARARAEYDEVVTSPTLPPPAPEAA